MARADEATDAGVGVSIGSGRIVGALPEVVGADEQAAKTNPPRSNGHGNTPSLITGHFATPGIPIQLNRVARYCHDAGNSRISWTLVLKPRVQHLT